MNQTAFSFGTWYPIESVLDSGERVILYSKHATVPISIRHVDVEYWNSLHVAPTHWMPLPPPPTEGE